MPIRGYVFIQPGRKYDRLLPVPVRHQAAGAEPVPERPALLPGVAPVASLDQQDPDPSCGQRSEQVLGPRPGGVGHDQVVPGVEPTALDPHRHPCGCNPCCDRFQPRRRPAAPCQGSRPPCRAWALPASQGDYSSGIRRVVKQRRWSQALSARSTCTFDRLVQRSWEAVHESRPSDGPTREPREPVGGLLGVLVEGPEVLEARRPFQIARRAAPTR